MGQLFNEPTGDPSTTSILGPKSLQLDTPSARLTQVGGFLFPALLAWN
jgi:hypothetical protein